MFGEEIEWRIVRWPNYSGSQKITHLKKTTEYVSNANCERNDKLAINQMKIKQKKIVLFSFAFLFLFFHFCSHSINLCKYSLSISKSRAKMTYCTKTKTHKWCYQFCVHENMDRKKKYEVLSENFQHILSTKTSFFFFSFSFLSIVIRTHFDHFEQHLQTKFTRKI